MLDETAKIELKLEAPSGEAEALVKRRFADWFHSEPGIKSTVLKASGELSTEGYTLEIQSGKITVSALDAVGVNYALNTLRQLSEGKRGTADCRKYEAADCTISDDPVCAFRGIHLCIFPETPMWLIEKEIRLAVYLKFNYGYLYQLA